jgi:hypothetical protein
MPGEFRDQSRLFSYIRPEERIPADHPLRKVRDPVREVLQGPNRTFQPALFPRGPASRPQTLSAIPA